MRHASGRLAASLAAVSSLVALPVGADPVCTTTTVRIEEVIDPAGLLQGAVLPGTTTLGELRYERTTPDTEPDPGAGFYRLDRFWHGLTAIDARVEGQGFVFQADPAHVDVGVLVKNSPELDQVVFESRNNVPISPQVAVTSIEWRFEDPSGLALVTDLLPAELPIAAFPMRTAVVRVLHHTTGATAHVGVQVLGGERVTCISEDPIERVVCIDLVAPVTVLDDPENVLQGAVRLDQILRGSYVYNWAAADANGLPSIGEYFHSASYYGMVLNADGLSFFSDFQNTDLGIHITSGTPSVPLDMYRVSSTNNVPLPSGATLTLFQWELRSPAGTAISTADLTQTAPELAAWSSNALVVEGLGPAPDLHPFAFQATVSNAGNANCFGGANAVDAAEPALDARGPQVAPNPFGARTTIRYRLVRPTDRIVRVFDVAGRCVRRLLAPIGAGDTVTMEWNGRSDSGRDVARGIYVIRVGEHGGPARRVVFLGR